MDVLPLKLRETIAQKSDEGLYSYFAAADEYTPETLEAVRDEIRKRGLPEDQIEELASAARASAHVKKNRPSDSTFTFNGCGTRLYGKCDFRADESHVTTMWITVLYWPIFPLRTLRIKPLKSGRYAVLERFRTNWQQASRTYGFVSLLVISLSLTALIGERFSYNEASLPVLLAGIFGPFIFLYWSRRKERQKCLAKP